MVVAVLLLFSVPGLEDDLVALSEDDGARPIFFLFAPANPVVRNGLAVSEAPCAQVEVEINMSTHCIP